MYGKFLSLTFKSVVHLTVKTRDKLCSLMLYIAKAQADLLCNVLLCLIYLPLLLMNTSFILL